jgi:hypothetical protein
MLGVGDAHDAQIHFHEIVDIAERLPGAFRFYFVLLMFGVTLLRLLFLGWRQ